VVKLFDDSLFFLDPLNRKQLSDLYNTQLFLFKFQKKSKNLIFLNQSLSPPFLKELLEVHENFQMIGPNRFISCEQH